MEIGASTDCLVWQRPLIWIVSHVKLCVLALLLERATEIRAGDTWRNIRLILDELKAVRYRLEGTAIVQSTHGNPAVVALLKKLEIPAPKRILALER